MRLEFDDEEVEPVLRQPDTELTLGPGVLLGLISGLVLLCALFFGLGYAVGHRAPQAAAAATPVAGTVKGVPEDTKKPKPSATPQGISANKTKMVASYADTTAASPAAGAAVAAGRAAENKNDHGVNPPQPDAASSGLMVQIAAVSHQEDAEVLEGALRKRGYTVTVRRDNADSLLHVRIGPFKSRDEADRWRQKLLNDGYNAIVQP
jgi:cell division septation protein DedD